MDYWIRSSFTHRGISYSQGEPAPPMTTEEAEALRERGCLARVGEPRTQAETERLLRGNDLTVLRALRRERPSKAILRELLHEAAERSPLLREAIQLALGDPVK